VVVVVVVLLLLLQVWCLGGVARLLVVVEVLQRLLLRGAARELGGQPHALLIAQHLAAEQPLQVVDLVQLKQLRAGKDCEGGEVGMHGE